ncbi:MAG: TM1266 family iron-only hydrogenase system putative regulator [Caldisericum sp.]|jgi:putative iron-only hydrogenase system regulator|uniref:TM1266 family iron-only hydrogenase system putative regulator n=1 Tax=Caldisericum TaxID=693074 RepID=UPI003C72A930
MKRVGVVGIIIKNREINAPKVNSILTEYGEFILGRMGIHEKERGIGLITLIIEMDTDTFGAFTGKLGQIKGVTVCSTLSKEVSNE